MLLQRRHPHPATRGGWRFVNPRHYKPRRQAKQRRGPAPPVVLHRSGRRPRLTTAGVRNGFPRPPGFRHSHLSHLCYSRWARSSFHNGKTRTIRPRPRISAPPCRPVLQSAGPDGRSNQRCPCMEDEVMWRAFFLAVGATLCILGVECLGVQEVVLKARVPTPKTETNVLGASSSALGPQEKSSRRTTPPGVCWAWARSSFSTPTTSPAGCKLDVDL